MRLPVLMHHAALRSLWIASIACMHGREIRQTFGVEGDFTAAERQAVLDKYEFLAQAEEARLR
jgi:hypothetical protein